jgi:hypothetical protein
VAGGHARSRFMVAVVASLGLVACGGGGSEPASGEIPLAEWAASYNALCLETDRETERTPGPLGDLELESSEDFSEAVEQAVRIARQFNEAVRALPPPNEESERVSRLIEVGAEIVDLSERLPGLFRAGSEEESQLLLPRQVSWLGR